jgi:anthranilate phosphoribosyltransferase
VGRGPKLSRPLDVAEAEDAMRLILEDRVEPAQLGAFLLLLRYRGETPEELAGFVRAARATIDTGADAPRVDLDWPSYADRHKQLPWFVLAALLLAENGVKVAMHGIAGESDGYTTTPAALATLGIRPARSIAEAGDRLETDKFAYLPIEELAPSVAKLFTLRPVLGVRSAVNTFARELNPLGAPYQMLGVFHPNYRFPHQRTAEILGQKHAAIIKGGGGEVQRNPEKPCAVTTLHDGVSGQEEWPAMLADVSYRWRDETDRIERIPALWTGDFEAEAPRAAIIGTAAIALKLIGRAKDQADATAQAEAMWRSRQRDKFRATASTGA